MKTFHDGKITLHAGDCLDVLNAMPENSIDAVVTDPPYHLTSIVKRYSGEIPRSNMHDKDRGNIQALQYKRLAKGFMGKIWDGGDIAFRPELWAEVLRVLKPGGHMVCFGGTRTYHRMVVAIEDAGFEIRDQLAWVYGSGFPKSHDIAKQIDKGEGFWRGRAGAVVIEEQSSKGKEYERNDKGDPVTDAARQWQGYGTALKPSFEPVCLARKPLSEGTVAANVLRWGTGALNIDGCRIPSNEKWDANELPNAQDGVTWGGNLNKQTSASHELGRWPANLCHDNSPEVLAGFPDLGRTSGQETKGKPSPRANGWGDTFDGQHFGDSGSAARFFASFPSENEVKCFLCNVPTAASKFSIVDTRIASSVHCDVADLPPQENEGTRLRWNGTANNVADHSSVCRVPTNGAAPENAPTWPDSKIVRNVKSAAILCDSCATSIAQGLAEARRCQNVGLVRFQDFISGRNAPILIHHLALYVAGREDTDTILTIPSLKLLFGSVFHAIASTTDQKEEEPQESPKELRRFWYGSKADHDDRLRSVHPTVKPVDLMQWLVRLVCPKGATVLDLFAGTGTTGAAAFIEGRRCVLIEREAEYLADIEKRIGMLLSGSEERSWKLAKPEPLEALPLFATVGN